MDAEILLKEAIDIIKSYDIVYDYNYGDRSVTINDNTFRTNNTNSHYTYLNSKKESSVYINDVEYFVDNKLAWVLNSRLGHINACSSNFATLICRYRLIKTNNDYLEMKYRIEEFSVIRNNKLDIISLECLFAYYNRKLDIDSFMYVYNKLLDCPSIIYTKNFDEYYAKSWCRN